MASSEIICSFPSTQPHTDLSAVQHIRKMRGGSQAHLLGASDGNLYITKFQNNPQHVRVLANEFLALRLARLLDLPVPDVEIIAVPDWLIEESPGLRIEILGKAIRCTSGLQLGVRYAADLWQDRIFEYLSEAKFESLINKPDFCRILVLDKWLGNCDSRQVVFTWRPDQHGYDATFIDQGYCFNGAEWTFPDLPMHGVFHRKSVYSSVTSWDSFEPVLSLVGALDCQALWQLASEVPPEWYQHDQNSLSRLVDSLQQRLLIVRNLITRFRNCSYRPFPNWQ